jgi:hypothetical protein
LVLISIRLICAIDTTTIVRGPQLIRSDGYPGVRCRTRSGSYGDHRGASSQGALNRHDRVLRTIPPLHEIGDKLTLFAREGKRRILRLTSYGFRRMTFIWRRHTTTWRCFGTFDFDPKNNGRLVGLAIFVCCLSGIAAVELFRRGSSDGRRQVPWIATAGLVTGCGICGRS